MHRRLLPLIALPLLLGCVSSAPELTSTGTDGGGPVCFSCGGGTGEPEDMDASLATRVRARFDLCSGQEGCHVSGAGGLTYPAGNELVNLVNVRSSERPELFRIAPGNPAGSYLYLKVRGDGGIEGGRMPLNATTFDPKIPATILSWIEAGAPSQ